MISEPDSKNSIELALAESLLERGKFKKALSRFEGVIAEDPNRLQARLGIAISIIGLRDFEKGLGMLAQLDPIEDPDLRARRVRVEAWALLRQKKWDQALAWLDDQWSNIPEAKRGRALLYKVSALVQLKRRSEAAEALRLAWSFEGLSREELLMIADQALGLNETTIARAAFRRLLRTRYALGAALAWVPATFVSMDRLLVWTPIALLLIIGAPLEFGIVPVISMWGIFAALSIIVGLTHRIPTLAVYGPLFAIILGGGPGLIALVSNPTLGPWAACSLLIAAMVVVGILIVRSRRRHQKQDRPPAVSVAPPKPVGTGGLVGPASAATTQATSLAIGPRRRLVYLIWPVSLLLIGAALCRYATRPGAREPRRLEALSEGIGSSRISYTKIESGFDDVRIALFVVDVAERDTNDGATEFTAVLINRGDYPVRDVTVYLSPFTADGQVVDVLVMEGGAGPISSGEESSLRVVFDPRTRHPRILEETLILPGGVPFSFMNLRDPLESPSSLLWLSQHVPTLTYSVVTTHPDAEWVGVGVDLLVGDVVGG